MIRRALFFASLTLGSFTPRAAVAGGCEKDTDCKGDRICEASACVNPAPKAAPAAETTAAPEASEASAEGEGTEASAGDEGAEPVPTDPKDWWKKDSRKAEAPVLQAIFDKMPRPFRQKGGGKLVYHRAVPVVVSDIHDTTTLWGGKKQINVRFMGISKVHTTSTLDMVTPKTPGIAYCPVNCSRIKEIVTAGDDITFVYDGDIKDWAGRASDVHAGYTRKIGKHHRAQCTFPVLYNLAPSNTWLDPEEVKAIQTEAVDELKRYCGL
jgi:hypothetical protein